MEAAGRRGWTGLGRRQTTAADRSLGKSRAGRLAGIRRGRVFAGLIDRLASRHERRVRATIAEALERAVGDVDRPVRRVSSAASVDRRAVAEAAPLLLRVADRLGAPGPLPSEALRLSRSLVGDCASPLYARSTHRSEYPPGTLSRFARAILAACEERRPVPAREPDVLTRS